ncbi:hypothetical protein BC830DRAFT_1067137 [Chytriomyces sp. MP71]|nr:hypothetical protein BC830DRAFT_1067137 [Chytriomyces sp. MP71]
MVKHKEDEKLPVFGEKPPIMDMWRLPSSSVWCTGNSLNNRVCKIRNICYNNKYQWFIVRNNASVLSNVPTTAEIINEGKPYIGLVEVSSVQDHPYTAWSYSEVSQFAPEFQNRKVRYHKDFTILYKRFHGSNIMHTLHDDVMPLFHHIRRYVGGSMPGWDHFEFNLKQHRLQFIDDYEVAETYRPFQYLTDMPIGLLSELNEDKELITCFRDATIGVKKLTTWYQYGFAGPQGPIPKFVNGLHVRMVADYFTTRLGLPVEDSYDEASDLMLKVWRGDQIPIDVKAVEAAGEKGVGKDYVGGDLIVILSRTRNRLISNEAALAEALEKKFRHQVVFMRNEDHSFEEQIILMRRAKVVVGMHGSILIMAMFCRKGTVLIEIYPWAVPSENYTPYKTMANLHGMYLVYRPLENKHPENTVSHEEWPEALGGIAHLPAEEQKKIKDTPTVPPHKCCVDPYWLFRIYQDTTLDIPEFEALLVDALQESARMIENLVKDGDATFLGVRDIMPPMVVGPMFSCVGEGRPAGSMWARWEEPWNGAKPDYYVVRTRIDGVENVEDPYTYYSTNTTELYVTGFKEGTGVIFSVKSIVGKEETAYGDEAICFV